jgi:hypothetical protein
VSDLKEEDLRFICLRFYEEIWFDHQKGLCERLGIEPVKTQYGQKDYGKPFADYLLGFKDQGLKKILMIMALNPIADPNSRDKDRFLKVADRYRVNHKQFRKEIEDQLKAKKKEVGKTKGKKKAKK